jgi:hypothetical protein
MQIQRLCTNYYVADYEVSCAIVVILMDANPRYRTRFLLRSCVWLRLGSRPMTVTIISFSPQKPRRLALMSSHSLETFLAWRPMSLHTLMSHISDDWLLLWHNLFAGLSLSLYIPYSQGTCCIVLACYFSSLSVRPQAKNHLQTAPTRVGSAASRIHLHDGAMKPACIYYRRVEITMTYETYSSRRGNREVRPQKVQGFPCDYSLLQFSGCQDALPGPGLPCETKRLLRRTSSPLVRLACGSSHR